MIEKSNGKSLQTGLRTNFREEEAIRVLFSDEKFFDIDVVYNSRNSRVCIVDRADTD